MPTTNGLSLCLLTWNEIEGCKLDVPNIPKVFDRIYAIDNSSTDGTTEFLIDNGIEVFKQKSRSYNGAYLDAFEISQGNAVIFFHPKGTVNLNSLEIAAREMRSGVDFLLASRNSKGAQNEEDRSIIKPRKWFVYFVAVVSKIRWGMKSKTYLNDPLHGYRGLSSEFIKSVSLNSSGVTADVEMIRHAYLSGLNLKVFSVKEISRPHGKTHFPALSTGRKILKYVLR
jgi:glycosyltransferase involved in cell wall biosynthesis